jgi:hypothetical protein
MDNIQVPNVREAFLVTRLMQLLPLEFGHVEISICARALLANIDACKREELNKHKLLN